MIDFIIEALFSTDGYSVAFSPLMLLPSLGSSVYGMAQNAKLKKDLEQKKKAAASEFERSLTAVRGINFEPGQGVRDAWTSQIESGANIANQAKQRVDETTAQGIAAMQDSPRSMQSALARLTKGAGDNALKADMAAAQMKGQGEMGLAQANEQGRQAGIQRDLGLEQLLMGTAQKAGDVAQSGIYASNAATTEGVMSMGNLMTQGLLGMDPAKPRASTEDPIDPLGSLEDNLQVPGATGTSGGLMERLGLQNSQFNYPGMGNHAEGGFIGDGGGMTEGEFDHASNKKAIVDEENGQKEGELTGGEIVFNPEQTADITGMVDSGDADGLLLLLQELLNQPQFQKA